MIASVWKHDARNEALITSLGLKALEERRFRASLERRARLPSYASASTVPPQARFSGKTLTSSVERLASSCLGKHGSRQNELETVHLNSSNISALGCTADGSFLVASFLSRRRRRNCSWIKARCGLMVMVHALCWGMCIRSR